MNGEDGLPFVSPSQNKMPDGDKTGLRVPGGGSSETDIPKRGGCRGRGIFQGEKRGKNLKHPLIACYSLLHLPSSPTASAKLLVGVGIEWQTPAAGQRGTRRRKSDVSSTFSLRAFAVTRHWAWEILKHGHATQNGTFMFSFFSM